MRPPGKALSGKQQAMSFFFAGLLPVLAFTLIEDNYGTVAGLVAGMIFGGGEIIWEIVRYRKVSKMTWIGNGLLLFLGGISLISSEGIWFKLQPAIMEAFFALFLWGSLLGKKNLIVFLGEQQGQVFPDEVKKRMTGMTLRMGLFFAAHAVLATWAALYWSTTAWAWLKGLGFTGSFVVYMVLEAFWMRRMIFRDRIAKEALQENLEPKK